MDTSFNTLRKANIKLQALVERLSMENKKLKATRGPFLPGFSDKDTPDKWD